MQSFLDQLGQLKLIEWVQAVSGLGSLAATIIAAIAAIAAFRSANVAREQLPEVRRQVDQARETYELQNRIRIETIQPDVWVDVRPDSVSGTLISLMVGNNGPSVARNVRVQIEPPLPAIPELHERWERTQTRLARGIKSVAPGRILSWPLGQGFNLIKGLDTQEHTFTIVADGPFGAVEPVQFVLDIADMADLLDRPTGSLFDLTKSVKELHGSIDLTRRSSRTPPTQNEEQS